jgi:hypothetical protein
MKFFTTTNSIIVGKIARITNPSTWPTTTMMMLITNPT